MKKEELELYTDYLISSFGYTTATGLSKMLAGQVSHDRITRFLSQEEFTSKDLWLQVKSQVRHIEQADGVLIFDDTVQEKQWTKENETICWHYDHSKGRTVKGFNLLNCLYHAADVSIPVAFELIKKPLLYCDLKSKRVKRKSKVTKNQLMREMLSVCLKNQLKFRFVLMDSWFASKENLRFIKQECEKEFICALKQNRLVALSKEAYQEKRFRRIDAVDLPENTAIQGWLRDIPFPVVFVRQVFRNKDGSRGTLYLVCSVTTMAGAVITSTYQKRWEVEVFHKSLKGNAGLGKAPVRTVRTQNNHVFAALYAVFKLECLKMKHKWTHFGLRSRLYIKALRLAFDELQLLKPA